MVDQLQAAHSAAVAGTGVSPVKEVTSSSLKNAGAVLDAADGGVVRIRRHRRSYVLIREDHVAGFIADATDDTPKTLAELLRGHTPEVAAREREASTGWLADPPQGSEVI